MTITAYEVGGALRDEFIREIHGVERHTKDVDIAVEAPSFEAMREWLLAQQFYIHVEKPEYQTIRCGVPNDHPLRERTKDLDAVLCRIDGEYSDGRRPDEVFPGSIYDDLDRRDARMNAIARDVLTGEILDPHNGIEDIKDKVIRTVGEPIERWREDSLRILRHFRQSSELGFVLDPSIHFALMRHHKEIVELILNISADRRRQELHKLFRADQFQGMYLFGGSQFLPREIALACFAGGIWLEATLKE